MEFSDRFKVIVKPNSSRTEYIGVDDKGRHKISLKERAEDNKANLALVKFFKKEFGFSVRIKSGLTNKEKLIERTKRI